MPEGVGSDWDKGLNGRERGNLLGKSRRELGLLETNKTNFFRSFYKDSGFRVGDEKLRVLLYTQNQGKVSRIRGLMNSVHPFLRSTSYLQFGTVVSSDGKIALRNGFE